MRLLIFSGGNHLLPAIFDGLPYPLKGLPPIFFIKNDRKGCTLDYLDGLGNFLFGFEATEGVSNHPFGKTRV